MEIHLFDADAKEEEALCGADTLADCRRSVDGYLEDRLNEIAVGAACEGCKRQAVPFAVNLARDLEYEDRLDEAQECRELAEKLARETSQDRTATREQGPALPYVGGFCVLSTWGPTADSHTSRPSAAPMHQLSDNSHMQTHHQDGSNEHTPRPDH